MSSSSNSVKGMQDILPPDVSVWQNIESAAREVFGFAGFLEIRTPILEYTQVFSRSIGDTSDIVEKEMYTFRDKGDRSVTMRPEGTASVVRSFVQHNLSHGMVPPQKLYYMGPMFRYERPQKGRLRQFYQIGVESFGIDGPEVDADVISMLMEFLNRVGLQRLTLELNSIGCAECRPGFRDALVGYFKPKLDSLCPDCNRRLDENPLRVLDCKVPRCKELRAEAPAVGDHLCGRCREHFGALKGALDKLDIAYKVNPEMVRGLDYYTRTTFEVTTDELGAQSAVVAGGRYDRLVSEFGGPDTPAVGFAMGMERLVALVMDSTSAASPGPDVFIASMGQAASIESLAIAARMRREGIRTELGYGASSLKSQLRRADKLNSRYCLIIGDDELESGMLNWKDMDGDGQGQVAPDKVAGFFLDALSGRGS